MVAVGETLELHGVDVAFDLDDLVADDGRFERCVESESRVDVESAQVDGQFDAHALEDRQDGAELQFKPEALGVEHDLDRRDREQGLIRFGDLAQSRGYLTARDHIAVFVVSHGFDIIFGRVIHVVISERTPSLRGEAQIVQAERRAALIDGADDGISNRHARRAHLTFDVIRQDAVRCRAFDAVPADAVISRRAVHIFGGARSEPHAHGLEAVRRAHGNGFIVAQLSIGHVARFGDLADALVRVGIDGHDVTIVIAFRSHHRMLSSVRERGFESVLCVEQAAHVDLHRRQAGSLEPSEVALALLSEFAAVGRPSHFDPVSQGAFVSIPGHSRLARAREGELDVLDARKFRVVFFGVDVVGSHIGQLSDFVAADNAYFGGMRRQIAPDGLVRRSVFEEGRHVDRVRHILR